jgi:HEAT repeat protein
MMLHRSLFSWHVLGLVFALGISALGASQVVAADAPESPDALVYAFKPELHYMYGFEMTSGDDGKGPWHIAGSISYLLEPAGARPMSIMEQAKRERQGASAKPQIRIQYSAFVASQSRGSDSALGVVTITPDGDVESVEGQSDFSMIAASASKLVFQQLPPAKQNTWKANRHRLGGFVNESLIIAPNDALRRLTGIIPTVLRSSSTITFRRAISEFTIQDGVDYQLKELTPAIASVDYKLKSAWNSVEKSLGGVEGEGQYVFDRTQGVLTSGYAEYKLKLASNGIEVTVPFQIAFRLKEALTLDQMKEQTEKNRQEVEQRAAKIRTETAASNAKRTADQKDKLNKDLATLKNSASSPEAVEDALRDLSMLGIDQNFITQVSKFQHDEVATQLNVMLKRSEDQVQSGAVDAAATWATPANIPELLELLQTQEGFRRGPIIRALGTTGGNEKVATVLAHLLDTNSRFDAAQALSKMKKFAEPAVLPLIHSTDSNTRRQVYEILGDVGGKKSQLALESIVAKTDQSNPENFQIKQALEKIKERLATKSD